MQWTGIEEQCEALKLMIHHLHGLRLDRAIPLVEVPRHEIRVPHVVARKLELAYQRQALRTRPEEI